jgi:hypothetical protein
MNTYIVHPQDKLVNVIYNYNRNHTKKYGAPITMDEVLDYNPVIVNPDLIYAGIIIYLPEIL